MPMSSERIHRSPFEVFGAGKAVSADSLSLTPDNMSSSIRTAGGLGGFHLGSDCALCSGLVGRYPVVTAFFSRVVQQS